MLCIISLHTTQVRKKRSQGHKHDCVIVQEIDRIAWLTPSAHDWLLQQQNQAGLWRFYEFTLW